jgi:type II secretory pathway component PulF
LPVTERVFDLAKTLRKQTGQLPLMRARAAAQIPGDVQRCAMATILEPLLIVVMGGVVHGNQ